MVCSHPLLGGIATQEPAHWISPFRGYPTFVDVEALWRKLDAELPPGQPVLCNGLDRLLQGAPELTNKQLDGYFPKRPALVLDNSGHEVYFNSAVIALNGWADGKPPADPVGARFGRNPGGTSNGRAYETAAIAAASLKVMRQAVPHPLLSGARWYALMATNGVTATTEHTYDSSLLAAYVALAGVPDCPLRLALYHMSIDPTGPDPAGTGRGDDAQLPAGEARPDPRQARPRRLADGVSRQRRRGARRRPRRLRAGPDRQPSGRHGSPLAARALRRRPGRSVRPGGPDGRGRLAPARPLPRTRPDRRADGPPRPQPLPSTARRSAR